MFVKTKLSNSFFNLYSETTFSDLTQSEGGEDEESLAQILLRLKERCETPEYWQETAEVSFRPVSAIVFAVNRQWSQLTVCCPQLNSCNNVFHGEMYKTLSVFLSYFIVFLQPIEPLSESDVFNARESQTFTKFNKDFSYLKV